MENYVAKIPRKGFVHVNHDENVQLFRTFLNMIAFALVSDDEAQPLHVEVTTRPRGRQLLVQLYYTCICTCVHVYHLFSRFFPFFCQSRSFRPLYQNENNNSCRIKTSKILKEYPKNHCKSFS